MITINFDFKDKSKENLVQLNNILSILKLDELRIENYKDYLAQTTDSEGEVISNRYGLGEGTLVCKLSESEYGYQYRIDAEVIDRSIDRDLFLQTWRDNHPCRIVRIFITSEFNDLLGCLIIHHQDN